MSGSLVSLSSPAIVDDPVRLAALERYAILDTPPEAGFDDIVQLACQLCAVPVALVSLVAGDRQWFKARVGFPPCETDLNSSVCAHALSQPDQVLVIPDLTKDARTIANPLVTGEPFIRFYAGAPLVTAHGEVLGSLCVIDKVPRAKGLTDTQRDCLKGLARQVMTQLELRRAIATRDASHAEERRALAAGDALRDTQAALAISGADLDASLYAVVEGAMRAVPAAEGGVVELVEDGELEYRAVLGSLIAHRGLRMPVQGTLSGHCATTHIPQRMADAFTDPYVRRDMAEKLKLRSAVLTPLMRGEAVLGVLKLQSSKPDAFTARDLEMISLFAGAAATGFTEAEAHAAMRASDIYWRGLFDRLSEGFVVGEVIRDAGGRAADWRYVEVNPAWGTLLGINPATVLGRSVRQVIPGVEDEWVDEFIQVVETGEPISFTRQVGSLGRWYEGRAFRLSGSRFAVIFLETTARVQVEARRSALLILGDRLRDLRSIPEMTYAAAEIVGRALGATRAGFGQIEGDVEHINILTDWTAPGIASIAGRHRFDDYGDLRTSLRRGEPLVIDDVTTDERTRDDPGPMLAIGIGALINMPVRERGQTVSVFIVHDVQPRTWTPDELAFLRNVADRLEVGVARVRAEDMQTVLNHELAHRLKNHLAVVQSIARQSLRGVTEQDNVQVFEKRLLALSRAHDTLLEKSWSAAKMRAIMEGVLTMQADLDRFALDGPDMDISSEAALSLSMLLHKLATNALKYGALSTDGGMVRITWRAVADDTPTLVLDWQETGGPAVHAPSGRSGFGSKLIRLGLLGTRRAELDYGPHGLRAKFQAPLASVQVQVH